MKQTAMISQPMTEISYDDILSHRKDAVSVLKNLGYDVKDTFFTDYCIVSQKYLSGDIIHVPLAYLAKSIEAMSQCDAVYFCKDWENARGCKIEHEIAKDYGLAIIYEGE